MCALPPHPAARLPIPHCLQVRVQLPDGGFALSHMDEVVDDMLRKDYMFDIALPRIPSRCVGGSGVEGALDNAKWIPEVTYICSTADVAQCTPG